MGAMKNEKKFYMPIFKDLPFAYTATDKSRATKHVRS